MFGMRQHIRDVFDITNTDKGYFHEYEHMYAGLFANFTPKSLLEIGVKNGRSIRAWQMLFPNASITGLDIERQQLEPGKDFEYIIANSTEHSAVKDLPNYDVIIEDGSHHVYDQILTFTNFKNKFNYYYVIEDVSYARDNHPGSEHSIKVLKSCIKKCGYRGIAVYDSYNKKNPSVSIVIQSNTF